MTKLSALELIMLADNALSAPEHEAERTRLEAQLEQNTDTEAALSQLRAETRLITHALQSETSVYEQQSVAIPKFKRPLTFRSFALANLGTGLVIWLAQFLWKTIFGELVMNATAWATSIFLPDVYAMASSTFLYLLEEGTAMFDAYLGLIVLTLLVTGLLGFSWVYGKRWRHNSSVVASLVIVAVSLSAVSGTVQALEIRRDAEVISVTSTETIDDTVILAGETIRVDGSVTGDVFAFGRTVEVTGSVGGNLVAFAEFVTVSGPVGGTAIGGANTYDLRGASVSGDLWVGGEKISVDSESNIRGNATIASNKSTVDGSINKDFNAFGESVELSGTVSGNLEAFANRLRLLGNAEIDGNVRIRSDNPDVLRQDDGVKIAGEVEFMDVPEEFQSRSRYTTFDYYLWQVMWLISAFIVAMLLLWLIPGLRHLSLGAGMEAAKTAGIGFLTLISVPVAAVLLAITLVGLPISLITIFTWLVALYLAKILVGIVIGSMIMDQIDWRSVLLGLAIVAVSINVPFIGGVLSFVLMLLGLGLVVRFLVRQFEAGHTP